MKETNGQKQPERRPKPARGAAEIGTVRVFFKPGPDAEDRLRRVFTILVKHAIRDRQAAPESVFLWDDAPAEGHAEPEV